MSILRSTVIAVALALSAAPGRAQSSADDPLPTRLSDAAARALRVHPSIEVAGAALRSAEAALSAARAGRLPTVALEGSATRFQEPMLVAPLHGFDPTTVPDFDATLVRGTVAARYTVFDGGRRGSEIARAEAFVGVGDAVRRDTEAELILRTAEAYLLLLSSRDVVAAQSRREAALDAEVSRARQLLNEGAAPRLELLRVEAELASVFADGETSRRRLELARTTLARLLDLDPDLLVELSLETPSIPASAVPALAPTDTALASDLSDAPAVARARSAAAAAEAGLDAARASWLPSIEAQFGYALYAGGGVDPLAEWQAGIQMQYPLFTGGARSGAIERAAADAARARAETRVLEEEIARAADASRTAEVEARGRVATLEAAAARFVELTRVERLALDEGAGTQTDWLRAEAGLFQTRAGLAEARHAVLRARLTWARSVGVLDLDWLDSLLEVTP